MDYISIFFDCYGIFEIYTFVGFFMVQIFSDCKRQGNNKLTERYYRFSVIKIIEKTEKYTNKINDAYIALEYKIQNHNKTKSKVYYISKSSRKNEFYIKENYDILDKYNTNMNISLRTEENVQLDKNDFIKDNLGKKEAKDQNLIGKDNERIKQ